MLEQRYKHTVGETLITVLETMTEALKLWEQDQALTAQNLARNPSIRSAAKKLLALPRNQESLLAADTQRQLMQPVLDHYRGYFIIAPANISLASSRDDNGRIIAILTLRLDPYGSLFTITNKGRLGES